LQRSLAHWRRRINTPRSSWSAGAPQRRSGGWVGMGSHMGCLKISRKITIETTCIGGLRLRHSLCSTSFSHLLAYAARPRRSSRRVARSVLAPQTQPSG
jgi:hypothetical protein